MRYWLVMPAAGAGRRFGSELPKQYAALAGRTVIEWSLAPFLEDARCARIVVAVAAEDRHWTRLPVAARARATTGGGQRSQSVRSGLAALAGEANAADWVLVHDAARPCLAAADLERLLSQAAAHAVGGLLAVPVADTLKRAQPASPGEAPPVAATQERAGLWRAQTPQMFRCRCPVRRARCGARRRRTPSDEAQALEWHGERPLLIEGTASNPAATTTADLSLASAILRSRHL
jgi:2-C-methyl-D-erythritol 4-phosphate cytidylyltransferase